MSALLVNVIETEHCIGVKEGSMIEDFGGSKGPTKHCISTAFDSRVSAAYMLELNAIRVEKGECIFV